MRYSLITQKLCDGHCMVDKVKVVLVHALGVLEAITGISVHLSLGTRWRLGVNITHRPRLEPWTVQSTAYHYTDYDILTIIVRLWFVTKPRIKCLRMHSLIVSRCAFHSTFDINRLIFSNEKYKCDWKNLFSEKASCSVLFG